MTCNIDPRILRYIEMVESGEVRACKDQHQLCALVRRCFETEDIYTDSAQLDKYLSLVKYFPFDGLFEWQEFCIALHLTTFRRSDNRPRWKELFLLIGRGAGKDGYIAYSSLCVTSPYSNLPRYDVDICANAEEQAKRPVNDILEILDDTRFVAKMKKHYYWTKEQIMGRKFGGVIKGRTNNPSSRDGMRSGMIVFNEIHQYTDYKNIKVFKTGQGKKKHPRSLYATTQGDVREGPLDDKLKKSLQILSGEIPDGGMLPFICRLNDKKEVHDKENWAMANPSLPYLPDLWTEINDEYEEWVKNPSQNGDFMTKRMNLPQSDMEVAVTEWENIAATEKELPDLSGWDCVCGIDYATINDFASVNLHFLKDGEGYDINHSWLCAQSKDLERIQAPWRDWVDAGKITVVDGPEIDPDLICEWIMQQGQKYNILHLALDNYRYALIKHSLEKVGFDTENRKNITLIRPSDIMKIVPVISSMFINRQLSWGDCPPLRWATNNTKLVRSGKKFGTDTGNFYYAKIEGRSRKTDPFMAFVASVIKADLLINETLDFASLPPPITA